MSSVISLDRFATVLSDQNSCCHGKSIVKIRTEIHKRRIHISTWKQWQTTLTLQMQFTVGGKCKWVSFSRNTFDSWHLKYKKTMQRNIELMITISGYGCWSHWYHKCIYNRKERLHPKLYWYWSGNTSKTSGNDCTMWCKGESWSVRSLVIRSH